MSGLEHLSPLLCLKRERKIQIIQLIYPLDCTGYSNKQITADTPLGPVQLLELLACLWVQGLSQVVPVGGAGCAVGAAVWGEA